MRDPHEEEGGKCAIRAGVTVFVNSPRKSTAKSGMNKEVTQCNASQTDRIAVIPLRVLSRLPRNPSAWNHSAPLAKEERTRRRRREYKKEGNSAGKKTERKEQVLVLKRAAMRGGGVEPEPTGWFFPPSLYRDPRTLYIRSRLGIEWYLHVTDHRCRDPSRVIRMWGPQLLFRSQPMLKLQKSSEFIVCTRTGVPWISFFRARCFLFFVHNVQ